MQSISTQGVGEEGDGGGEGWVNGGGGQLLSQSVNQLLLPSQAG